MCRNKAEASTAKSDEARNLAPQAERRRPTETPQVGTGVVAESAEHQERVRGLVDWMGRQGVQVTHAAGGSELPDPYAVGRHEPDALGTKDGVLWIGESKVGTDLYATTSQEQFVDFSRRHMSKSGRPCPFILCVPKGYDEAARKAVIDAGGSTGNLTVIA